MGYTHYWNTRDCTDDDRAGWQAALPILRDIAKRHRDILCYEFDQPTREPDITKDEIRLNGKGDAGHETFFVHLSPTRESLDFAIRYGRTPDDISRLAHGAFCKTDRKPYDLPVCEILLVLQAYCPNLQTNSDGFLVRLDAIGGVIQLDRGWQQAMAAVQQYGILYRFADTVTILRRSLLLELLDVEHSELPARSTTSDEETGPLPDDGDV